MERHKNFFVIALVLIVVVFSFFNKDNADKKERKKIVVETQKEAIDNEKVAEENRSMNRERIVALQNQAQDNLGTAEAIKEVKFTGYEEKKMDFAWMTPEEWNKFKEQFKVYLAQKDLSDVTEVRLHPDSIQTISDYEKYVYLDVDYKVDGKERLPVKAICDTYTEIMRFTFEIQYSSWAGGAE